MPRKVLEFFAGIGGAACAFQGMAKVVGAIDINQNAAQVYRANFDHPYWVRSVEDLSSEFLSELKADTWWVSAPCQPFTRRGNQRDDRDRRSAGLETVVQLLAELTPQHFLLENVVGFAGSRSHARLRQQLSAGGYDVAELHRCPTELGIPNRRPRFYLLASRTIPLADERFELKREEESGTPVEEFLDQEVAERYFLDAEVVQKYLAGLNVVGPREGVTNCFTSGYGKSLTKSGSYLWEENERIRRFTPREIARFLGLEGIHSEPSFRFPPGLNDRQLWKLLGNSISAKVVRGLIQNLLELQKDCQSPR